MDPTPSSYRDRVKMVISAKIQAIGITRLSELTGVSRPRLYAYQDGDDLPSDLNLRRLEPAFDEDDEDLGELVR
jgi:hypothetical protein